MILPYLRKNQWAAKVDLKDAYFHLPVEKSLRQFLRVKIGDQVWEYQAAPFGISTIPQLFMSVMRVLENIWRKQGIQVYVYLDDILIVGASVEEVNSHLEVVVKTLIQGGFKINVKKSTLEPTQEIQHLGFLLDFKEGLVKVPPHKLKLVRRELGKTKINVPER